MREGPPQGSAQAQPPSTPAPAAGAGQAAATPAAPAPQPRNLFAAAAAAAQNPAATPTPAARGGAGALPGAGGPGNDAAELEALRNNPLVAQLRQLVQTNPALLQPFLQQVGTTNPQLFQLINRNQQAFLEFLTEGSGVDLGALGDDMDMEGGQGGPGGDNVIQVTAEERDSIERLQGMGFDRQIVLQAFIACDRNEELTANYLIENGECHEVYIEHLTGGDGVLTLVLSCRRGSDGRRLPARAMSRAHSQVSQRSTILRAKLHGISASVGHGSNV